MRNNLRITCFLGEWKRAANAQGQWKSARPIGVANLPKAETLHCASYR